MRTHAHRAFIVALQGTRQRIGSVAARSIIGRANVVRAGISVVAVPIHGAFTALLKDASFFAGLAAAIAVGKTIATSVIDAKAHSRRRAIGIHAAVESHRNSAAADVKKVWNSISIHVGIGEVQESITVHVGIKPVLNPVPVDVLIKLIRDFVAVYVFILFVGDSVAVDVRTVLGIERVEAAQ
jgi:hypothetical protein